jgi:hypothetical protein
LKRVLLGFSALLISSMAGYGSVTINLGGAELFQSDGTTPIPLNSLIQLVASTTDNTFTLPSTTSFTGGSADDQVIASFGTNNASGQGSFLQPVVFSYSGNFNAGDQLILRWWPSLTTAASTPGVTTFGQFRTDNVENFSSIAWVAPADGNTESLNFLDQSGGGSEPDSAGRASFSTAAVPETSTVVCALLSGGAVVFHAIRRRLKK